MMGDGRTMPEGLPTRLALLTDPTEWGGAEIYLSQLVEGLRGVGFEPHVFCSDRRVMDPYVEDLEERGIRVTRFLPTKEYNPVGLFVGWKHLRGYELVHFNKTDPRTILPAVAAARPAGARVVVTTEHLARSVESHFPFGSRIITALVRLTNRLVDRTIAVSELSRQMHIDNYGVPPDRIVAIRNGVDVSRFGGEFDTTRVREELGIPEGAPVATLVGRLQERKGHTHALKAAPAVRDAVPDARLLFVGKGELESELRAEAEALDVSDFVVFAGFRRDIPDLLASSDLLILPSDNECLPLTILEAMATGLPVVATDVGGVSEEVEDGVTGYLIPPHDTDALAEAMIRVLRSPDRGAKMGEAGRRKVESEFSIEACIGSVVRLYEQLYREKRRAS